MDFQEVIKTISLLSCGGLFELRAVGKVVLSGYFTDAETAIKHLQKHKNETFYIVLNEIDKACYSREQSNVIITKPKKTTADCDIVGRNWILVDIDPKRISGVSATDGEKEMAKATAKQIYFFLKNKGVVKPIIADSGNGYHLLYRIFTKNKIHVTETIKTFLSYLDMTFTNEHVEIDTSVHNAARITKLYGTMATKGANTAERPHRLSKIIYVPKDGVEINSIGAIQKIATLLPKPQIATHSTHSQNFSLQDFISKHGIQIVKINTWTNGTRYILSKCLFNEQHESPDAAIIQLANGALAYNCFHNSCQQYRWHDVREMFEPGAYNPRQEPPKVNHPVPPVPPEPVNDSPKFLTLAEIKRLDRAQIVSMPTGITALDKKLYGLNKGEMTIWSGANGSGKSTMLTQLALETVNSGFRVVVYSGEMADCKLKNWIHLQAAGRKHTQPTQFENDYFTPAEVAKKIDRWFADSLYLYNNSHGNNASAVLHDIKNHVEKTKVDMIIVDNLMSLDLGASEKDKYDAQSRLAIEFSKFAKNANVHIVFVCHPRKATGFLRKIDISGTADITNIADNVIMSHRVNEDFKNDAKKFYGAKKADSFKKYTNVLEVMKNRDLGVQDEMFGMYYEIESKRLMNTPDESKRYGWDNYNLASVEGIDTSLPF